MDDTPTMIENRTFAELAVGDSASTVRTLRQEDIELFAVVSGDVNPAHLDPAYAETDMFHKIIAHGMWGGALISMVLGTILPGPGTIYLGQELRFRRPVGIGDTITTTVTVAEKHDDTGNLVLDCVCSNQDGKLVISGRAEVRAPQEKVRRPRMPLPEVHLDRPLVDLTGKRGLIVGIANDQSIAAGCARVFSRCGATLAATFLNAKAEPHVRRVTDTLDCPIVMPCDVEDPAQLEAVFETIRSQWGRLDFLLHSIAFAPRDDLHGRVIDSTARGFAAAIDVSCHSFLRMARLAEPLMIDGGCLLMVSFLGSERVVPHYNLMGPVKAALESAVRYAAVELGPKAIRAHAISPGPIATRAASGIDRFDELLRHSSATAPEPTSADIDDVGALAAFLVSDAARHITGTVIPVDSGQHLLA